MAENKQRLILLFDGTWNDPQDRTNVYQLSRRIEDYDGKTRQHFFYDPGVGTGTFNRFTGGAFGAGLSKNLQQGYDWLARNYTVGNEIYVFGFSRGAYTARSLVGMIRKCGLLHISTPALLDAAEKIYRNKQVEPDDSLCRNFRAQYSREVSIHMIGVWDTVGALGIPGTLVSERGLYSWHDTQLSKIVERAYQAMALDEHRAAYDAVLWTSADGLQKPQQLEVEQRWFIGAHANVGGGYGDDPLAELPLAWMLEKAAKAGLKVVQHKPSANAWQTRPHDSFSSFLGGGYGAFRRILHAGDGRHYRAFDTGQKGERAVGVTIDPSVWARWSFESGYRPPTLVLAGKQPPG